MRPPRNKPAPIPTLEDLKQKYMAWLYNSMFFYTTGEKYWLLSNHLFKREFYWTIPNDDNRGIDGLEFRGKWSVHHFRSWEVWWDAPCTVFELLVGLACRMEDILENPTRESTIRDWYILLISNLGLKAYTDSNWSSDVEKIVDQKIDLFLDRQYDRNGNGGLFPLEHSAADQRKVEIWYQLMKYIDESFDI